MAAAMFCRQCEQAARNVGCDVMGNCGKDPVVAALLDLMIHGLKGISQYAAEARKTGARDEEIDLFMFEGLFTTVTNVNFDPVDLTRRLNKCWQMKEKARHLYENSYRQKHGGPAPRIETEETEWRPADDVAELVQQGRQHGVRTFHDDQDILSAMEIVLHGLKGMAAFAQHASFLGKTDEAIFEYVHRALAAISDRSKTLPELVDLALECGKINLRTMEILYEGHAERLQDPQPMKVRLGTRRGKGIVVSGHDLRMLDELLKQSEGKGVDVYTHGEMLPANGYPGLRKYGHFAGNFGTAWQNQTRELPDFPGAIIFNTNCIQRPHASYTDRLFTWGEVAWPGTTHIDGWDFTPVIEKALQLPDLPEQDAQDILVGFGHAAVLGVAQQVIDAVKSGAVRHFFLIGGCDGAKPGRNYYTDLAQKVPQDCVILTLACGKNRFNRLDFGDIGGIPRLLDVGQCNDAYSAIRIALALADAFGCSVNDLPLTMILSWYEQKAHVILLTLFYLGIKDIRLGPSLPAYVSPNVLNFLAEKYGIGPISTPEEDIKWAMSRKNN